MDESNKKSFKQSIQNMTFSSASQTDRSLIDAVQTMYSDDSDVEVVEENNSIRFFFETEASPAAVNNEVKESDSNQGCGGKALQVRRDMQAESSENARKRLNNGAKEVTLASIESAKQEDGDELTGLDSIHEEFGVRYGTGIKIKSPELRIVRSEDATPNVVSDGKLETLPGNSKMSSNEMPGLSSVGELNNSSGNIWKKVSTDEKKKSKKPRVKGTPPRMTDQEWLDKQTEINLRLRHAITPCLYRTNAQVIMRLPCNCCEQLVKRCNHRFPHEVFNDIPCYKCEPEEYERSVKKPKPRQKKCEKPNWSIIKPEEQEE